MPNDLTPTIIFPPTKIEIEAPNQLFTFLGPNAQALLHAHGSFREAQLYEYDGKLYAKVGSAFIKLMPNGQTSKNKTYWKAIYGIQSWSEAFDGLKQESFLQ